MFIVFWTPISTDVDYEISRAEVSKKKKSKKTMVLSIGYFFSNTTVEFKSNYIFNPVALTIEK